MSRIVIGTAGHIDHGKTALVKALTGIDTDRLKEEKKRGITIELGFAPLVLPGGSQVAIIDVPGHERFIKNMLAGAAGIDVALLIVAANEGVMPQTREHLNILSLLAIREVIVVITKIDLVEEEFLSLVREEVQELFKDTPYSNAKTAEVSVYTGQGLNLLLRLIEETILMLPGRRIKEGLVRIPVDRSFKVSGFGTVVTGTIFDGTIRVGDILEVPSKPAQIKVRNLQVHGISVQEAFAGQRVAINLTGAEVGNIIRGDVLGSPGWLSASTRLDLSVLLLKDSPWDLVDMMRIRFHQGTKETLGRIFLLGKERLLPGEEDYIQVVLEEPAVVVRGDNYVLRSYSPSHTIGGGRVIEAIAYKHKKGQRNLREELVVKATGDPYKLIEFLAEHSKGIMRLDTLVKEVGLSSAEVQECLMRLINEEKIIEIKSGEVGQIYLSRGKLHEWEELIAREINSLLQQVPLAPGLSKEIARTKIDRNMSVRDFNLLIQLMVAHQVLRIEDNQYLLPYNFVPRVSGKLAENLTSIMTLYNQAAWQVPDWKSVKERISLNEKDSKQLLTYLLREGKLIQLADDFYLPTNMLRISVESLIVWFQNNTSLSVAQFRDLLGTSRRVAIPLLEYLDRVKITDKKGDLRSQGPALFDNEVMSQV